MFLLFRKACLLHKTSKIVSSRFIFTIYDIGLQGVTRGCRELQGITGGYKGLQGVTGGYQGLHGVTGGDKCLQKTKKMRIFPNALVQGFGQKFKISSSLIFMQNRPRKSIWERSS